MKYPKFLKETSTIGFVAPSFGACGIPYGMRFIKAKENFEKLSLKTKQVEHINILEKGQSANKITRAKEWMDMYTDDEVDFLLAVAGGERMVEILPFIDFELIKKLPPKYFMGYSDNTCLTFLLPILCDIATIYGVCATDFGINKWDECLNDSYNLMRGTTLKHHAYKLIQLNDLKADKPMDSYNLEFENKWRNLNNEKSIEMHGRIIGGCLDSLVNIVGTSFDLVNEFILKYKDDGIIWCFEACDLNSLGTMRALWQLKEAGWFNNTNGVIFGRASNNELFFDVSHEEAIKETLMELNIPIITDLDFGHVPPMFPIIMGSMVNIINNEVESSIEYILK